MNSPAPPADVVVNVSHEDVRASVLAALEDGGLASCPTAATGGAGPVVVVEDAPDSADAIASRLRAFTTGSRPRPALVLIALDGCGLSPAQALDAGADDIITWPQDQAQLAARVKALLRRRAADMDVHPLTGLPGGAALHAALHQRLPCRGELALLAFDLRTFKAFNDRYGFLRGDAVLKSLAGLLESVAMAGEIVYHIGGDDFFAITTPRRADQFAQRVIEGFDARVREFYDEVDRRNGFVIGLDRGTGAEVRFPLMGITVACSTNEAQDIDHVGHLVQVLTEVKEHARHQPGSRYLRDRRQIHHVPTSLELRPQGREAHRT